MEQMSHSLSLSPFFLFPFLISPLLPWHSPTTPQPHIPLISFPLLSSSVPLFFSSHTHHPLHFVLSPFFCTHAPQYTIYYYYYYSNKKIHYNTQFFSFFNTNSFYYILHQSLLTTTTKKKKKINLTIFSKHHKSYGYGINVSAFVLLSSMDWSA
jgi:hypothetical protein